MATTFAEDFVRLLAKGPREDAPTATEAASNEAISLSKRAEAVLAKSPTQAVGIWLEALDLDASCSPAYLGLGRVVLARAIDERPAVETAVRLLAIGLKRVPQDPALKELDKKLHSLLPPRPTEPALAVKTSRPSDRHPMAGHGAGRICEYCKSPIPIGAIDCKSCSMSGELPVPKSVWDTRGAAKDGVSPALVVTIVLLVVAGAVATWLVLGKGKTASSATKGS